MEIYVSTSILFQAVAELPEFPNFENFQAFIWKQNYVISICSSIFSHFSVWVFFPDRTTLQKYQVFVVIIPPCVVSASSAILITLWRNSRVSSIWLNAVPKISLVMEKSLPDKFQLFSNTLVILLERTACVRPREEIWSRSGVRIHSSGPTSSQSLRGESYSLWPCLWEAACPRGKGCAGESAGPRSEAIWWPILWVYHLLDRMGKWGSYCPSTPINHLQHSKCMNIIGEGPNQPWKSLRV